MKEWEGSDQGSQSCGYIWTQGICLIANFFMWVQHNSGHLKPVIHWKYFKYIYSKDTVAVTEYRRPGL